MDSNFDRSIKIIRSIIKKNTERNTIFSNMLNGVFHRRRNYKSLRLATEKRNGNNLYDPYTTCKDRSGTIDVEEMRLLLIDAVKSTLEKQAASADTAGQDISYTVM